MGAADNIDDHGNARRLVQQSGRRRQWEQNFFPTSSGGRLAPLHPKPSGLGSSAANATVAVGGRTGDTGSKGELIRLQIGGSVGPGGRDVTLTNIQYQNGFTATVAPTIDVLLPYSGIYGITGAISWTAGSTIIGYVDAKLVGIRTIALAGPKSGWSPFLIADYVDASEGNRLAISVDHGESSSYGVSGTLTVAFLEPLVPGLVEVAV